MKKQHKVGSSNFTTPKPKHKYKSEDAYIDAIYRNNPDIRAEYTRAGFKERIKLVANEESVSKSKAAEMIGRTSLFMTKDEIAIQNFKKGRDTWQKELRQKLRKMGDYRKGIDWSELEYDEDSKRYVNTKRGYAITFLNPDDSKSEAWFAVEDI